MKNILVINGHPIKSSLNHSLAEHYFNKSKSANANVKFHNIADMPLENYLRYNHFSGDPVGKDILKAREDIAWADHIVIFHPVWWGGTPAILKLYIDMVFASGFAFKYIKGKTMPEPLLKGKTARIISTSDTPNFIYKYFFGAPSVNQIKKRTLYFCGIKPVQTNHFGPIRTANKAKIQEFLLKVEELAAKDIR